MYTQSTQMHNIHLEGSTNVGTLETEQEEVNNVMHLFSPDGRGPQALLYTHTPPPEDITSV